MSQKSFTMIGVFVGSTVGSYVPTLWGGSLFSMTSIFLGGVGAIVGLWLGFRLGQYL